MKLLPMALLWLGAAVSISEIFTGGMLAPLGLAKGLAVILGGHLIGTLFLAFAGSISFARKKNAMESAVHSFGSGGGKLIALCNVVQLLGWTIVMIVQGASAIRGILPQVPFAAGTVFLSLLILVWALIFGSPVGQGIHNAIVILLSLLCVVLFWEAATTTVAAPQLSKELSIALAIELSIAMPVSWLPLVGDYSCKADSTISAALMPFAGYFVGSVLMYFMGLFIAVNCGVDIFTFISTSRFAPLACAVILFSTMTTAFLDLYSAVVSLGQFIKPRNKRLPLLIAGVVTLGISALFPVERYSDFLTGFLTVIGMVFVPVYALLFLDWVLRSPPTKRPFPPGILIVAAVGMGAYQVFSRYELWIPTLLTMALVCVLYLVLYKLFLNNKNLELRV
ncbi:SLC5/6 family protein [Breznakiellaceae bacterium SP9]